MMPNIRACWHDQSMAALTAQFRTDAQQGLTHQEAAQRLHQWGPNALRRARGESLLIARRALLLQAPRRSEEPVSERQSLGEKTGLVETEEIGKMYGPAAV
jgi:hypothetical protein